MSTRVQTVIDAAQELTLLEQLDLISVISQSLYRSYQGFQPGLDFWQPPTLEQLIQSQQTQPITDLSDLEADFWPTEESADEIIEYIYQQRKHDGLDS